MAYPLTDYKLFKLSEAYEVVNTVTLVMAEQEYRIEVLKCYSNSQIPFTSHTYVKKNGTWVDAVDFPWTARDSADSVLAQALGFLAERARQ